MPSRPDRLAAASVGLCALAILGAGSAPAAPPDPPSSAPLIVGGGTPGPKSWRFAAVLKLRPDGFTCTASVVSPTLVITAAHCVQDVKTRRLLVRAGGQWSRGGPRGEKIPVADVEIHPGYNHRKSFHDVALLRLKFPTSVPPVALPSAGENRALTSPGRSVRAAGWGARSAFGFRVARRLKATRERVYGPRRCDRAYSKGGFLSKSMICTLGKRVRRFRSRLRFHATSCSGDSGGPLVARTPEGPVLVGVVSVGAFPCGLGAPSIYTRVSTGIPFIKDAGLAPGTAEGSTP